MKPLAMAAGLRSNGVLGGSTADRDSATESRFGSLWWSGLRTVGRPEGGARSVSSRHQELEREKVQLTSDHAGQVSSMSDQIEACFAESTCAPSRLSFFFSL